MRYLCGIYICIRKRLVMEAVRRCGVHSAVKAGAHHDQCHCFLRKGREEQNRRGEGGQVSRKPSTAHQHHFLDTFYGDLTGPETQTHSRQITLSLSHCGVFVMSNRPIEKSPTIEKK